MDLESAKYSNADVVRATGVKHGTLQMWLARKAVRATEDNTGPGKERRYSASDVAKIAVISGLASTGLPISTAGEVMDEIQVKHAADWVKALDMASKDQLQDAYLLIRYSYLRPERQPERRVYLCLSSLVGEYLKTYNADSTSGWVGSPEGLQAIKHRAAAYEIGSDIARALSALGGVGAA